MRSALDEKLDLIQEAQEALRLCIDNVRAVVRGTSMAGNANAYIIPHLESWLDWRGTDGNLTLEKIEENLREDAEGYDEDEDEYGPDFEGDDEFDM